MQKDVIQINGGITINVDVSVKNVMYVKSIIFGILLHVVVKMDKYLTCITDDSAITCDEINGPYDEETSFNEKKATCKMENFYILLAFLLITIVLLITLSIYCYLIRYQTKQNIYYHFIAQTTN